MERIDLSETEKKVLKSFRESDSFKRDLLPELTDEQIGVAMERLNELDFVRACVNYGITVDAEIKPKGKVYLFENPTLDGTLQKQIEVLQKRNLQLSNSLMVWKIICIVLGIIIAILSFFKF